MSKPQKYSCYLTMTLNKKGPVSSFIDTYAQDFIDFAASKDGVALEIGAAYGSVTIAALKAGAKMIANDIEPAHLDILFKNTPKNLRPRLTLLHAKFPQEIEFKEESLDACYISRVLGYLTLSELTSGFRCLFRWLKPGAKLYILSSTVYRPLYKALIPIYEKRVAHQEQWPGLFENMLDFIPEKYKQYVSGKIHFIDDKVLRRELTLVGFQIETAQIYSRVDLPEKLKLDGREGVAVIAIKP